MTARAVRLVALRPADWPLVRPLLKAFYQHFDYAYSDRKQGRALCALLADARIGAAWQIQVGAAVVGYAVISHGWSIEYGGRFSMLDELFIVPAFRGRGIGRRALAQIRREASRMGARKLLLEVESYNRRAKALYVRRGFEDTRRSLMRMDVR